MKDLSVRTGSGRGGAGWVKPVDQMDLWLDTQGYYRKHTARDGTCLFRAVSEQLFLSQTFHSEVRKQVVDYMLRHEDHFQKITCPLIEYADKMYSSKEWGGKVELDAMARLYRCDIMMYEEIEKPAENITNLGYKKKLTLCYSQDRHYDSVYTKDYIATAAFCQSTVYEILYKNVFELKEVDYAVNKMLHDKSARYQRDHIPFLSSGFALRFEMRDSYLNVKELLDFGITPFPYKVAKSLDVEIYRNVEYDTWNEYRKGLRYGFWAWNCQELQVGAKCLVKMDDSTTLHGHVQEMQANKGPVLVFIEEFGEMRRLPFDTLELLPSTTSTSSSTNNTPQRPSFLFKLHPLQLIDQKSDLDLNKCYSVVCEGKKVIPNVPGKAKSIKEMETYPVKPADRPTRNRDVKTPPTPVVSSTDFEQDVEYQPIEDNYSQQFQTITEVEDQVCPDSTKQENISAVMTSDLRYPVYGPPPQPVQPLTLPVSDTNSNYQHPVTVNLMAAKSHSMDGSDLPHTDVATLRFFYNLGLDHLRTNCVVRPGAPYYTSSGLVQPTYITAESPTVPPYDVFPQPVQGAKKTGSGGYEGVPVVQQCEVSSTTGYQLHPLPPQMYPVYQQPPPPQPHSQPLDCDQYCMTALPSYMEYPCYDYPIYQAGSPHAILPSSYITPDGVIYQTVLPPGVIPTSPM